MSLFQQSTTTLAQAKVDIASSAGKDDDATMLTRAERSLQAAFRYLNKHRTFWDFTRAEASDISMDGSTELADLPYDLRALYDVRFITTAGSATTLSPLSKRQEDRTQWIQPYGAFGAYDLFKSGTLGKIRVVNLASAGTLKLKLYRRLAIPCAVTGVTVTGANLGTTLTGSAGAFAGVQLGATVTGTNVGAAAVVTAITNTTVTVSVANTGSVTSVAFGATTDFIDIPGDYEDAPIAWAKAHFLANNGGDAERQKYWQDYANEIIANMIANNNFNEDEELSFSVPADELGMQSMSTADDLG